MPRAPSRPGTHHPPDSRRDGRQQDVQDSMRQPYAPVAGPIELADVVQERRHREIVIPGPQFEYSPAEPRGVAPIGGRHALERRERGRFEALARQFGVTPGDYRPQATKKLTGAIEALPAPVVRAYPWTCRTRRH